MHSHHRTASGTQSQRAAAARRNTKLGWCPCGAVPKLDCDCCTAFRYAVAKGEVDSEPTYREEEA